MGVKGPLVSLDGCSRSRGLARSGGIRSLPESQAFSMLGAFPVANQTLSQQKLMYYGIMVPGRDGNRTRTMTSEIGDNDGGGTEAAGDNAREVVR